MALVVVAYDISHDRRRAKVHTLLLAHGEPVQESLFECDLDPRTLRALRSKLRRLLHPTDKVRLYPLCETCAALIDDGRGNQRTPPPTTYVA